MYKNVLRYSPFSSIICVFLCYTCFPQNTLSYLNLCCCLCSFSVHVVDWCSSSLCLILLPFLLLLRQTELNDIVFLLLFLLGLCFFPVLNGCWRRRLFPHRSFFMKLIWISIMSEPIQSIWASVWLWSCSGCSTTLIQISWTHAAIVREWILLLRCDDQETQETCKVQKNV